MRALAWEAWHLWLCWRLAFLQSIMVPPAGSSANRANLNQWVPTGWQLLDPIARAVSGGRSP